jgi:hypothetical protein
MRVMSRWLASLPALLATLVACGGTSNGAGSSADPNANRPESCPARAPSPNPLPGVRSEHRTLDYWLLRAATYGDLDEPLLDAQAVASHRRALLEDVEGRPLGQIDLAAPIDRELLFSELTERLGFVKEKFETGTYLEADGSRATAETLALLRAPSALPDLSPAFYTAEENVPLRCAPRRTGFYTDSLDLAFDRNNCSTIRPGELVQVLAQGGDMKLARTSYSLGWIANDAPLSSPVSSERAAELARARPFRPLTRRATLEAAFALLDQPYGWGDHEGGRDCSRYLMDVFDTFGLAMPRHSARQAIAGTYSIDVSAMTSEREKLLLIDEAAARGVVLLHFPGHIMLYLGRDEGGVAFAIHSFAEYLEPCPGVTLPDDEPPETLRTVDRITVSTLELGRDTTRKAFIERITRVTVLGKPPGPELVGSAEMRPVAPVEIPSDEATCEDSLASAIFRSPAAPNAEQPLRVIATLDEHPGPLEIALRDPTGNEVRPAIRRLGGPPFTYWVEVPSPAAGAWTAAIGDGSRIVACERITVARGRPSQPEPATGAWEPRWRWENDTENLYAAFVEQLFDYPVDEDLTWPNLQTLLLDRDHNLLHGHLGFEEDARVRLGPDCADLPYFLRAYFAWKTRLPFGFRQCSRGRAGAAPTCGDLNTHLEEREGGPDSQAFMSFVAGVRDGVHSATARTLPRDSRTDVYPVPLSREALRPGTVYADPYGHLLVIARWVPQTATSYGMMLGADAQPDGTIGRRRFWRGTFLFRPETTEFGAGFKAWRPLTFNRGSRTLEPLSNEELRRTTEHVPFSDQQYTGSMDDFYDRMDALINPRPLEPRGVMTTLVDALEESVVRRVNSVQNGVDYMNENGWPTAAMPDGHDIFETSGAWEDYSTPSRDMRLLIAIDAVMGFPDVVERQPQRFALSADEAGPLAAAIRGELRPSLAARHFDYTRSDGSTTRLTLADIVDRAEAMEIAYNPNDCPEHRWGAREGTDEASTCRNRAPPEQQRKMERYREWFRTRTRPPRGT